MTSPGPADAGRPRTTFVVGHLPPPVHGMAVATQRFAEVLDGATERVRALPTSGVGLQRTVAHHVRRTVRTALAAGRLLREARRGDAVYLSSDAGLGMVYTAAALLAARTVGAERWLHHHSYAYISARSRLMGVVVRAAGPGTTHIVSCCDQRERFGRLYPAAGEVVVVPIAYAVDLPPAASRSRSAPTVLGLLSNLTVEKGVLRAVETVDRCRALGLDVRLVLAGPLADDDAGLRRDLEAHPGVELLGPVYGEARDAFLAAVDVFLFPSLYRHESFGLVVAEAMASGCPVVAHRAGCLDADWVGDGGLVLDPAEDFADRAAEQVRAWSEDGPAYVAASAAATARAGEARREGLEVAAAVAARIARGPDDDLAR